MSNLLSPEELIMFGRAPEDEIVDLAIDLDVPVPEQIDLAGLLSECVRNLATLGRAEGLPYSPYDREDLENLTDIERSAIAGLNGVDPKLDSAQQIDRILKTGKKIYKTYKKNRPNSQIPLYLPMLLAPLARYLVEDSN
ncbi:MAG: hypothetical protein ACPGTU_13490 [Myxococcota bacterium]